MTRKLGFVVAVAVLFLTAGLTMAASPGAAGPAAARPTPILDDLATPTKEKVEPPPVQATPTQAAPAPTAAPCPGSEDAQAMEAFRAELLGLVDVLNQLYPYSAAAARASGKEAPPKVDRKLIESANHDELCRVRTAFGADYAVFKESIEKLKSMLPLSVQPGSKPGETGAAPDSFTIIPTPTPVASPTPGILHRDQDALNEELGDLPEPDYPTAVGCPKERYPWGVTFATLIAKTAAAALESASDLELCEGTFLFIGIPLIGGFGTNMPGCLAWAILKTISVVADAVDEGFKFCNDWINSAEVSAALLNLQIIHAELAMADWNVRDRANLTDHFIFEFRNLNLRSRIEANLASDTDDPVGLLSLPGSVCISPYLENISLTNQQYGDDRIAGCGLLDLVQDTVNNAMQAAIISGQKINNAPAEYQAALDHMSRGEWKLAYARFRKAYREVARAP